MRSLSPFLIVAVLLLAGCSGDSASPPAAWDTPAVTASPPASAGASPTPALPNALQLVYYDRSRGQAAVLYIAEFDGSAPKKVATLPNPSRPLDVQGKEVAVASGNQVLFYDLLTGQSRALNAGTTVSDGRFAGRDVFLYTSNTACTGAGKLVRVNTRTLEQRELLALSGNLQIAGVDVEAATVAIVPRGCDPQVHTTVIYETGTGKELLRLDTPGCGFATADLAEKKVLVSWMSCTPSSAVAPQATVYDYTAAPPATKHIVGSSGGINSQPLLLRPGAKEAVFGTKSAGGSGPGSVMATGVWQVDLATLSAGVLVPGSGLEQTPIEWTTDGRYLLVQSVEAMGRCLYSYADASSKQVRPVNAEITFCGANGDVVGWTSLP